jgi:DNA-binding GntR family transcriptional regulator
MRQARSASVAPLSTNDLAAIYRLRYVIELPLAGASAGRRGPTEIARLDALLEASRDPDPEIAWQAHYDFHEALVHPAANAWDERVLHTLWTAAERYTHLVFDPTQISDAERRRRYRKHRLLRDAALVEDPSAMAEALHEHLSANEDRIRDHISAIESQPGRVR